MTPDFEDDDIRMLTVMTGIHATSANDFKKYIETEEPLQIEETDPEQRAKVVNFFE